MDEIGKDLASAIPDPDDRATLQKKWGYEKIKRASISANKLKEDPSSAFRLALQKKLKESQNAGR